MTTDPDPRSFLPLSPLVFQVLLALADGPRHGYGIIQEIDSRTNGDMRLRTGTLYLLLRRLTAEALVEPTRTPRAESAAARRLQAAVVDARAKRVLSKA